jgi:release factor glutamine methyltransferase
LSTTTINLSAWLESARHQLAKVADQPSVEAQALLAGALKKNRAWIFTHPEAEIPADTLAVLTRQLERRADGEPLPYLLGQWEFYGLNFIVTPAVLIPRPETEMMVDLAREWLKSHPATRNIVDAGTGSGCIIVSLAHWSPGFRCFGVDRSFSALQVAKQNIARHNLQTSIHLVQSDLLSAFHFPLHLICANLPYIPTSTMLELDVARHEPRLALDGGADGLRLIEPLMAQAVSRLARPGRILLEIEMGQDLSAPALARQYFPGAEVALKTDLAGLPRVVVIDWK